jgi:hypothetical protein
MVRLRKLEMENDLFLGGNGRRPQTFSKRKTTFNFFEKWKTTSNFLEMEDDINFLNMEDDIYCKWKMT